MLPSSVSVIAQFLVAILRLVVVQQRILSVVAQLVEEPQRLVVEVHKDHLGEVSFAARLERQG